MASKAFEVGQALIRQKFKKPHRFETAIGSQLPEAYRKFWKEWQVMQPAAVHYIHKEGNWRRNPVTGELSPIQNIPIPLKYPQEFNTGLWGGEAVVKGFIKKHRYNRRVPHYWVPNLKRSVVRSEVLNTHLSVVITDRTLNLIHDNYGFDHYLLKTPACDLRSELALTLKRKILEALLEKCPAYDDNPDKQSQIYDQYKNYLSAYTPEEIEWYGLTWMQAIQKLNIIKRSQNSVQPLKHKFRSQLIEQLKIAGIGEVEEVADQMPGSSWISKMNPFGKKRET